MDVQNTFLFEWLTGTCLKVLHKVNIQNNFWMSSYTIDFEWQTTTTLTGQTDTLDVVDFIL